MRYLNHPFIAGLVLGCFLWLSSFSLDYVKSQHGYTHADIAAQKKLGDTYDDLQERQSTAYVQLYGGGY